VIAESHPPDPTRFLLKLIWINGIRGDMASLILLKY